MKVQIYLNEELKNKINMESESKGISTNMLIIDILEKYYGLIKENELSEAELNVLVIKEILEYVDKLEPGTEFDLNTASNTFANIEMSYNKRPSIIRAKIGKNFATSVKNGNLGFGKIELCKVNGKVKRNKNRAAIYRKIG